MIDIAAEVILALALLALVFVPQWRRRAQARRAGATTAPSSGMVGTPNPAVPTPAAAPDHRTGIVVSGRAPLELQVCGLPALAWQRAEHAPNTYQGMRLSLIVDAGVGLPVLHMFHRAGFLRPFAAAHGPAGIPALDERYRISGDLTSWRQVLGAPTVQQALLAYPLQALWVFGGRLTFVSNDGVHLDPDAVSGLAGVAAAVISAIPAQITGAAAAPPPTASVGTDPTDPDAVVATVLARSELTPEQQQALLALVRANRPRP
ncbi:MAG: hypothetical protein WBQ18_12490 [Solirubrobacteraceae bacterium]